LHHVDIGSRIDGFLAHLASFRSVEVFDIRPLEMNIPNVTFKQLDIMNRTCINENSIPPVSCLHTLEHFGLGRYGNSVNFNGFDIGFFKDIASLLESSKKFYFTNRATKDRISCTSVFSLLFLIEMISPFYTIDVFSYVYDQNNFHPNEQLTDELIKNNCHCRYGCGIFELTKK